MRYNIVFSNGNRFDNMTESEFYVWLHGHSGNDYAVYNNKGELVGPFDAKGNFVGEKYDY